MTILGYTIAADDIAHTLTIILVIALTILGARVAGKLIRKSMAITGALPSASIFVNIARVVIYAVGMMTVLSVLDISITPAITALGVSGLAVALALQDTLSNLFAGLQIIATRQIRPGDYLVLESAQEGIVADIAWRTTTLHTTVDNLVIVPNAVLGQAIVTNYKLPAEAVAVINEFGVAYDADLDLVERVTLEVAEQVLRETGYESDTHAPVFRYRAFADSQITCAAIMYVPSYGDQFPLRSAFIKTLHQRFTAEGIQFPFPTRTVHLVQE
jgi:small-conductance mechanosensitive channel